MFRHYMKLQNKIWMLALIIIVIFFIYNDKVDNKEYDLTRDGVCVIKQVLTADEIDYINQQSKENNYKEIKTELLNNPNLLKMVEAATNAD